MYFVNWNFVQLNQRTRIKNVLDISLKERRRMILTEVTWGWLAEFSAEFTPNVEPLDDRLIFPFLFLFFPPYFADASKYVNGTYIDSGTERSLSRLNLIFHTCKRFLWHFVHWREYDGGWNCFSSSLERNTFQHSVDVTEDWKCTFQGTRRWKNFRKWQASISASVPFEISNSGNS